MLTCLGFYLLRRILVRFINKDLLGNARCGTSYYIERRFVLLVTQLVI
jgi:hypothetical protein